MSQGEREKFRKIIRREVKSLRRIADLNWSPKNFILEEVRQQDFFLQAKQKHHVGYDEEVFLMVDHSTGLMNAFFGALGVRGDNTLLLLEDRISVISEDDEQPYIYRLRDFTDVTYADGDFLFHHSSGELWPLGANYFNAQNVPVDYLQALLDMLSTLVHAQSQAESDVEAYLHELGEQERWEDIVRAFDEAGANRTFYHYEAASEALVEQAKYERAISVVYEAWSEFGSSITPRLVALNEQEGRAWMGLENTYRAYLCFQSMVDIFSSNDLGEFFENLSEVYRQDFLIPCHEAFVDEMRGMDASKRAVVYFPDEVPLANSTEFMTLPAEMRKFIELPIGHPREGQLYVAHPHRPMVYYPIEEYESVLFREKYLEFCTLAQDLGASHVSLEASNEVGQRVAHGSSTSVEGSGRHFTASAGGGYETARDVGEASQRHMGFEVEQSFTPPTGPPRVPTDLVWFSHEPEWQALVRQRLEGRISTHSLSFSTRDIRMIDETTRERISAELESLAWGASGALMESLARQSEHTQTKSYRVRVEFYPLEDTESVMTTPATPELEDTREGAPREEQTWTANERDMLEMLQDALDDGVISADEERLLTRMQRRWGISDDRMDKLKAHAASAILSDEEREYLEEFEFAWSNDHHISAGERRLLDRLAAKLGLSAEQVEGIESRYKLES